LETYKKNLLAYLLAIILFFPFAANLSIVMLFFVSVFGAYSLIHQRPKQPNAYYTYFILLMMYAVGFVLYEFAFMPRDPITVINWNTGIMFAALLLLVPKSTVIDRNKLALSAIITISLLFLIGSILISGCGTFFKIDFFREAYQTGCVSAAIRFFSRNSLMVSSMVLVISHMCILYDGTRVQKLLGYIGYLLGLVTALFVTDSRGAALAFVAMFPIVTEYTRRRENIRLKKAILLSMIIAALIASIIYTTLPEQKLSRYFGAFGQALNFNTSVQIDSTAYARVVTYEAAVDAFMAKPITGYGMSNRWTALEPYIDTFSNQSGHSNNAALNHLVSGGIFGLMLFFLVTLFPVVSKYRSKPQNRDEIYLAAIVAAALHGNGLTTAIFSHYMHGTFWAVALVFSLMITFDPKLINTKQNQLETRRAATVAKKQNAVY